MESKFIGEWEDEAKNLEFPKYKNLNYFEL